MYIVIDLFGEGDYVHTDKKLKDEEEQINKEKIQKRILEEILKRAPQLEITST